MLAKNNKPSGMKVIARLLAIFSLWFSLASTSAAFNVPPVFTFTPPAAPATITAPATVTATSVGSWTVSWGASATATGYELWESLNEATWARVANGSGRSKRIDGKTVSGSFRYRVRACNHLGCSPYTAIKTVIANIGLPSTLTVPSTINTSGTYSISRAAALLFSVLQTKESGDWSGIPAANVGGYLNWVESAKPTGQINYRLRTKYAFCLFGCSSVNTFELPKGVQVIRTPAAVAVPSIANKTDEYDQAFVVTWVESNEAERYELWRARADVGASNFSDWVLISDSEQLRYEQSAISPGIYRYRVRACNYSCSNYSGVITTTVRYNPHSGIAYTEDGASGIVVDSSNPNAIVIGSDSLSDAINFELDDYLAYFGDLNNDGCNDIYLAAQKRIVIIAAEINIPIQRSATKANLLLNGVMSGSQCRFEPLTETAEINTSGMAVDTFDVAISDLNSDGFGDLILASDVSGQRGLHFLGGSAAGAGVDGFWVDNPLDSVSAYVMAAGDETIGATGGAHEVAQDGSANYTIQIPVPGGRGGLTPELSLAYNSNGGNTELGVGWDIGGLRLIHRCSSNYAIHGAVRGINFDDNDKLCMDGQALVAVGGTYGKSGATYRTVSESFAAIKSMHTEASVDSTDSGSTVSAFKVRTKDGKTLWFGNTPDARLSRSVKTYGCTSYIASPFGGQMCIHASVTETKKTYQWMLSKIEDRFGNAIDFEYENNDSNGTQRITEVSYNGGLNKVKFTWSDDRPDKTRAYFAGSLLQQEKRLTKVVSYSATEALRSLHLTYANDGATQYSKLTQVEECTGSATAVCLAPTRFDWSLGDDTYDWQYSNISRYTWRNDKPPLVLDLNGDGFDDLLVPWADRWEVAYGGTNGFNDWTVLSASASLNNAKDHYLLPLNYDDDAAVEILASMNGNWWIIDLEDPDTATLKLTDTGLDDRGYDQQPKLMDVNADGRTDLVYRGSDGNWWYRLVTSAGFNAAPTNTGVTTVGGDARTYSTTIDYNGDGLQDIIYPHNSGGNTYKVNLGTGIGFMNINTNLATTDYKRGVKFMDLNGDGLTDALFRNASGKIVYVYNEGARFGARNVLHDFTVTDDVWRKAKTIDFNTDGKQDLLIGPYVVYTDINGSVSSKPSSTLGEIPSLSGHQDVMVVDLDGNSLDDFVVLSAGTIKRNVHRGERPDYIHTITNGMGVETKFHFRSLHQGSDLESSDDFYDPEGMASYPLQSQIAGSYLVSELEQSDGLGDFHSTTYKYRGGRTHLAGMGSLGFSKLITLNNDTGIRTEATFSQDYANNLQGTTTRVQTIAPNGTSLSDTSNVWVRVAMDPGASGLDGKRFRVELRQTEAIKHDLNGAFMSREVSDYRYDTYGNIKTSVSKVYSAASGGALLRTSSTTNTWVNKTSPWLLGLLTKADTRVTDHSATKAQLRKVVTATYDETTTGRKTSEQIRKPANNAILNETRFGENLSGSLRIDRYGNLLETSIKGPDFANRSTRKVFSSNGLQLLESYDAQSNKTTYQYYGNAAMANGAYPGKVQTVTAPNGLKTYYKYDRFGRTTQTINAYGTAAAVASYSRYNGCTGTCRTGAEYTHTRFSQGGVPVHTEVDQLGRTVRKRTLAMDGRALIVDTNYNHLGHSVSVSNPYFAGESQFWNHLTYDILGRPVATVEPSGRRDTVTYNGLTKTAHIDVNGKNQSKTEYRNALNNLVRVTDNAGVDTTFEYDSLGRQTKVTGPSNKPITITYNALGHKVEMSDPDKGVWKYTSNGLGQLITQTSAKGDTTCMAYDTLGRMVKRYDHYTGAKATSVGQNAAANQQCTGGSNTHKTQWAYYTSGNGKGQLNTVASPGYAEKHYYDTYNRPNRSDTTVKSKVFTVNTTYDSLSRPLIISYPSSSAAHTRLEVKQRYNALGFNTGTYSKDGSQLYNRIEAVDSLGNITNSYFGNGIRSQRQYAKDTGYLKAIYTVGVDLNNAPQDYAVAFDLVGNLTTRADAQTGFEATYDYDNMNRLRWAYSDYGDGLQTTEVRYDTKGNISYKTGVGTYTYGSAASNPATNPAIRCGANAGPHAVADISGTKNASYCYDRNGNQVSGDGRNFTYTPFDKPSRITKNGTTNWIDMHYGAGRQLVWRNEKTVLNGTTFQHETYLIGGVYERVIHTAGPKAGKVEERHTVGNAIVTYKHNSNGSNRTKETVYTHTDHLGSIVAITDSNGFVKQRMSFDPWGKRRQPSAAEYQATSDPRNFTANPFALRSDYTNKGFTGHQQLDGVGIIHMGGRIYDAELGRFLQADPFVNDRTHSQALNRYTYVENNPLSYTDPSGYFLKKLFKKVGSALNSLRKELVWKPIKKRLQQIARVKWLSSAISVALNFIPVCQGWCSMLFNAAMTMANGGTIGQVLAGAAIAAVAGGMQLPGGAATFEGGLSGVVGGAIGGGLAGQVAGTMLVSGAISKAQGGKFIDGVKGAAIGMAMAAGVSWAKSKITSWGQSKKDVVSAKEGSTPEGVDHAQKSDFDKFMDFTRKQGVERSADENFKVEQVAGKWSDLPKSVRDYEPGGYGSIVDDLGDHIQNQRLPGGYHLSVDVIKGPVNLHFDAYDPLNGPIDNYRHWYHEVRQIHNGSLTVPAPSNNHTDWGK